jgi:hypothetical protein
MIRSWLRMLLGLLLLTGTAWAQDPSPTEKAAWDVLRWDYPAAPVPAPTHFILEVCFMEGKTCVLRRQWAVDARLLAMQMPKPAAGETKCYVLWAVGEAGPSAPSNQICRSP